MLKPVIVATAALAIAGSSLVCAQQRDGDASGYGDGGPRAEHRHRPGPEDIAAFTDARIAALKAGLELTPDQAKNWPAFEQALRDVIQLRIQLRQARHGGNDQGQGQTQQQGQNPSTPFDRMGRRADDMAKLSAALKRLADAGVPLYQSLTDAQKGRFDRLASILRPHHRMANNEYGGGWREGRGYGGYGYEGGRWFRHQGHRFDDGDDGDDGDSGSQP